MTPLVAAVVLLRAEQDGAWLPSPGEVAHAIALRLVGEADPALATKLHDGAAPPSLTACLLRPGGRRDAVAAGETVALRLTALGEGVPELLRDGVLPAQPGRTLLIGGTPYRVEAVASTADQHPLAASTSYEELSQQHLFTRRQEVRLPGLRFVTPTAFKSGGHVLPLPLPELVFGSLLDRWDAFGPLSIPRETRRFAAECLALGSFQIASERVAIAGGRINGFTGAVWFSPTNHDPFWLGMLSLLAAFAPFAGVGMKTAMGMGQARLMQPRLPAGPPDTG